MEIIKKLFALSFVLTSFIGVFNANAESSQPLATENFSGTFVHFAAIQSLGSSTLTISGPNGYYASQSSDSGAPSIELSEYGDVNDGQYHYQLTAALTNKSLVANRKNLDNGRGDEERTWVAQVGHQGGQFYVEYGSIITFSEFDAQ